MDDIGIRLNKLLLDCLSIRQQYDAEKNLISDSMNLVDQIIAVLPEDHSPVKLRPYAEIISGLCAGFESNKGVHIEVQRAGLNVVATSSMAPADAAQFVVHEAGTSGWLTLEFTWNWEMLLAKHSVHVLLEAAALPGVSFRPKLRLQTMTGVSEDIDAGSFRVGKTRQILIASMVLPESLETDYDYSKRPKIILFLDIAPVMLNISKLFFW